jgi:methylase of polypeptide subunit release factors
VLNERPMRATRIVDIGCGSGAGGIAAARAVSDDAEAEVLYTDINPEALLFAQVSARLAGLTRYRCLASDVLQAVPGPLDLVIANPPYMCDAQRRAYRHGGDGLGIALSLRIVAESLPKLAPGGRLVLYTGAPSIGGVDMLAQALEPLLAGLRHDYVELDPDVFGSELQQPAYADVERIAVVGVVVNIA